LAATAPPSVIPFIRPARRISVPRKTHLLPGTIRQPSKRKTHPAAHSRSGNNAAIIPATVESRSQASFRPRAVQKRQESRGASHGGGAARTTPHRQPATAQAERTARQGARRRGPRASPGTGEFVRSDPEDVQVAPWSTASLPSKGGRSATEGELPLAPRSAAKAGLENNGGARPQPVGGHRVEKRAAAGRCGFPATVLPVRAFSGVLWAFSGDGEARANT
jgi:hypothetical protein